MKFSDLKCCPFCDSDTFYERTRVRGTMTYYLRFDGEEAHNEEMYDGLDYKSSGRVWCANCGNYLGNYATDEVGVKADRAYHLNEIFEEAK